MRRNDIITNAILIVMASLLAAVCIYTIVDTKQRLEAPYPTAQEEMTDEQPNDNTY